MTNADEAKLARDDLVTGCSQNRIADLARVRDWAVGQLDSEYSTQIAFTNGDCGTEEELNQRKQRCDAADLAEYEKILRRLGSSHQEFLSFFGANGFPFPPGAH